jgi:predicted flavoprotein YhiN
MGCRRGRWRRGSVPGLFFIGEAVDVTGWLGGFNFQWAWASGVAAGKVS